MGDHFFDSRDAWYEHEAQRHRVKWSCNTENHSEYDDERDLIRHFRTDHDTMFDDSRFASVRDVFRRRTQTVDGICNLCSQPSTNLKSHVARHLQQMALFALPRVNEVEGSEKAEQDTRSSQQSSENDLGIEMPQLMELMDELRECMGKQCIDPPQIVAVGDQSCGKSSVLGALTNIHFPVGSGICTRFPTHFQRRRGATLEGDDVRIIAHDVRDQDRYSRFLDGGIDTGNIFQFATAQIFPPNAKNFLSRDILSITQTGPKLPHVTAIDLPGLIHGVLIVNDVTTATELAHNYANMSNTILLAIISGIQNIYTQSAIAVCCEADPTGARTLGVITKPDLCGPDELDYLVIKQASNRGLPVPFRWHVLRNLSEQDRHLNTKDRDEVERSFFETSGLATALEPSQLGIYALQESLSALLIQFNVREVSRLQADIKRKLSSFHDRLQNLGPELDLPLPKPRAKSLLPVVDYLKNNSRTQENEDWKLPHAFVGILEKRIMSILTGTEWMPGFQDALVKDTFEVFYIRLTNTDFRNSRLADNTLERLLFLFTVHTTNGGMALNEYSWTPVSYRHVILFLRLVRSILNDEDWARNCPALVAYLAALEYNLLEEIDDLDHSRKTVRPLEQTIVEIKDFGRRCAALAKGAMLGLHLNQPSNPSLSSVSRKLRSRVDSEKRRFIKVMTQYARDGLSRDTELEKEPAGHTTDIEASKDTDSLPMSKDQFITEQIQPIFSGIGPSPDINWMVLPRLFQQYSRLWPEHAARFINEAHRFYREFLREVVILAGPSIHESVAWDMYIIPALEKREKRVRALLDELDKDRVYLSTGSEHLTGSKQCGDEITVSDTRENHSTYDTVWEELMVHCQVSNKSIIKKESDASVTLYPLLTTTFKIEEVSKIY